MRQKIWTPIEEAVRHADRGAYDRALEAVPIVWQECDHLFGPERTLEQAQAWGWPVRDLPVHDAARTGQVARMEAEIHAGAPIDARNLWHETPVMLAARNGQTKAVRHLLEGGADATLFSLGGRGLIRHAVGSWDMQTVEVALAGAHALAAGVAGLVAPCYAEQREKEESGSTLARRVISFLDALRKGDRRSWRLVSTRRSLRPLLVITARGDSMSDVEVFQWLSEHGIKPNLRDGQGRTVLGELAIESLAPDVVGRMVRAGVSVDSPDRMGCTPLWHAVAGGTVATIEALVAAGARPEQGNRQGWTPVMLAARRPRGEVQALLHSADSRAWHARARAILEEVSEQRPVGPLRRKLREAEPLDRETLVVAASAWRGTLEQLDALLGAGADLEMRDPSGRTVLHASVARGEQIVRGLLARGADARARHEGWSAADAAHMISDGGRYRHHVATAHLLEEAAKAASSTRDPGRPHR